jgi:ankyrin repeat protein
VVNALIEAGADVNKIASAHAVDTSGKRSVIHNVTPVYFAAEKGHTPCVMELITAGADVNLARNDGCTALYMAARLGHEVCVALLIQAGADIHKAANHGWTPLATAVNQKHKKIVALLKHFGTA